MAKRETTERAIALMAEHGPVTGVGRGWFAVTKGNKTIQFLNDHGFTFCVSIDHPDTRMDMPSVKRAIEVAGW